MAFNGNSISGGTASDSGRHGADSPKVPPGLSRAMAAATSRFLQTPALSSSPGQQIKSNVHRRLLDTMDLTEARRMPVEQLYQECSRRVDVLLNEQRCPLSAPEKQQLLREVMDDIFGLGPIEEFLRDPAVSDILVNGSGQIYIEREGCLHRTTAAFRDDQQLLAVIQR